MTKGRKGEPPGSPDRELRYVGYSKKGGELVLEGPAVYSSVQIFDLAHVGENAGHHWFFHDGARVLVVELGKPPKWKYYPDLDTAKVAVLLRGE